MLDQLAALAQGGLTDAGRSQVLATAESGCQKFRSTLASPRLDDDQDELKQRLAQLESRLAEAANQDLSNDPLARLPGAQREFFGRMIGLIYSHSVNQVAAKAPVDRILEKEIPKHVV